ncbi:glutaredoxin domain-containing cysteine-rich protein CG31559 isoform X2 [Aplysia californica]|uniref:Glutaredoxin domain-containing cysteine-rich protein CG31559 isoform X2 n=1 Tax=Aplysia californica TaxID=6500 RepID=A0ABM0JYI2_APLCA|nr:glutaredoxin domain-containing cysteine-rich protein CG31559 isoform X2 [Aplysia californica]
MFRNFVKPAAFGKESMRECQGEPLAEIGQGSHPDDVPTTFINGSDVYTIPTDVSHGYIGASENGRIIQSVPTNAGKGGYTTSIMVNGTSPIPRRHSSEHSQVNGNQNEYDRQNEILKNKARASSYSSPYDYSPQQDLQQTNTRHSSPISTISEEFSHMHTSPPTTNSTPNYYTNGPQFNQSQTLPAKAPLANGTNSHSAFAYHNPEATVQSCPSPFQGSSGSSDADLESEERDQFFIASPPMMKRFNVVPSSPAQADPVFVGRRDVRDPKSVHERQIVSSKGTVRGFKNRVRAGIATFWAQPDDQRNYRQLEQGKIVIYATTMSVVRETSERCKVVRCLLQNHMVRYEERDLYMSREIQQELRQRLAQEGVSEVRLPHVFADGIHLGGSDELEKLNEAGELRGLLDSYAKIVVRIMCEKCGGYRFVPCETCHGSKRSLIRNHFTEEFCALRCMQCDENGLRRCDMCKDQQE